MIICSMMTGILSKSKRPKTPHTIIKNEQRLEDATKTGKMKKTKKREISIKKK